MNRPRTNHLMARKVEVGIVYCDMLGETDGVAYLQCAGVPAHVIERVAHHPQQRRKHQPWLATTCVMNDCPYSILCSKQGACIRR